MPPAPIRATTQQHLDVLDITDDIYLLKDGSVAMVIQTSAVNFDLLSEREQEAVIYSYGALLNSLTFPIQVLIRSQRKDVSSYLKLLEDQENKTPMGKRKTQINQYRDFISQVVKEGNVLDKKFYCVIPFSRLELGLSASNPLTIKRPQTLPYEKSYILNKALATLNPKRDHLIRQFSRMGLQVRQLKTAELTQLLYNVYNPGSTRGPDGVGSTQYQSPMVQTVNNKKEFVMDDTKPNQPTDAPASPTQDSPAGAPTPPAAPPVTPPGVTPTPPAAPEPTDAPASPTQDSPAGAPTPPAAPPVTPTPPTGDSSGENEEEEIDKAQDALNQASQGMGSTPPPAPSSDLGDSGQ
jgi:hypothetical protein